MSPSTPSVIVYSPWDMSEEQIDNLVDVTPKMARDLFVVCFSNAQKEMLSKSPKMLTQKPSDDDIREMAENMLRHKTRDFGGNFDEPTKDVLSNLIGEMSMVALSWGTPKEIVEKHMGIMRKIVSKIQD